MEPFISNCYTKNHLMSRKRLMLSRPAEKRKPFTV
jgi:hypothetical protein